MKDIIGYKCKNCGKTKGKHQVDGLYCLNPGRNSFNGFCTEKSYEEDHKKPVYGIKI